MDSRFCGNCGSSNPAEGRFCLKCGNQLAEVPQTPTAPPVAPSFAPAIPAVAPVATITVPSKAMSGVLIGLAAIAAAIPQNVWVDGQERHFPGLVASGYWLFQNIQNFGGSLESWGPVATVALALSNFATVVAIVTALVMGLLGVLGKSRILMLVPAISAAVATVAMLVTWAAWPERGSLLTWLGLDPFMGRYFFGAVVLPALIAPIALLAMLLGKPKPVAA